MANDVVPSDNQQLYTIKQFVRVEPAFTEGGLRWRIFHEGDAYQKRGAIVRFGSRILINREKFIRMIEDLSKKS